MNTNNSNAYDLIPADLVLPKLYETDDTPAEEKIIPLKLFTPDHGWIWFIVEYDPTEDLAFGFAHDAGYPDGAEWGYISIAELRSLRGGLGLLVERDIHWEPKPFPQALAELDGIEGE